MNRQKIKKAISNAKRSLTEEILGWYYASPLTFAETRRQMYGFLVHPKEISRKQLYNTVDRMSKRGWLEKKKIEDEIFYNLTREGRIQYLIYRSKTIQKQRGEQATIIIFDIPEEKRKYRDFLRSLLKQMKFTMIQKSVFIAPYVLPKDFYDLLKEMKLLSFVKIIEGRLRLYL